MSKLEGHIEITPMLHGQIFEEIFEVVPAKSISCPSVKYFCLAMKQFYQALPKRKTLNMLKKTNTNVKECTYGCTEKIKENMKSIAGLISCSCYTCRKQQIHFDSEKPRSEAITHIFFVSTSLQKWKKTSI